MKTTSILMNRLSIIGFFLILTSCSSNKVSFNSADEIEAKTINLRTKNRFFIPKENYKPIHIRVNMIYLLGKNGEGNYNGKNQEDNKIFSQIYKNINHLYANLVKTKDSACYTGKDFIKDAKIQFDFKSLFVKDSFARNYRNAKGFNEKKRTYSIFTPSNKWYLKYLDDNINDTIQKKGINAYFNMDTKAYEDVVKNNSGTLYKKLLSVSVSQFPSYSDFNRSSQVCFPNKYTKRLWMEHVYPKTHPKVTWKKNVKYWFINEYGGFAHELGHSLSLTHGNEYHRPNKCNDAIMSQSGKAKRNYIQPTEIGKIHKALMTSNLIQFIPKDANYDVPKIVSENENWDFKTLRFYQDIIVEEGKILILNGKVILPDNASILLEKEAILVLNNATLQTATNKPFTNIIKEKHAKIITY